MHWILVAGAHEEVSKGHLLAAERLGRALGRGGFGLICARWSGVDYHVTRSFRDSLSGEEEFKRRFRQIDSEGGHGKRARSYRDVQISPHCPDGTEEYSEEACRLASSGILVPGCEAAKAAMDALIRMEKPVLPVASLGADAFEAYLDILERWESLPIRNRLTRAQFLELSAPDPNFEATIRLLHAAHQDKHRVFVSYRIADVPYGAYRVKSALCHRYGRRAVFMDVDSLEAGQHFPKEFDIALSSAQAVVVIVGPKWEGPIGDGQRFRIREEHDWCAAELRKAHARQIPVLPVFVGRQGFSADLLPDDLEWVVERQGVALSYHEPATALNRLFRVLDPLIIEKHQAK